MSAPSRVRSQTSELLCLRAGEVAGRRSRLRTLGKHTAVSVGVLCADTLPDRHPLPHARMDGAKAWPT
jgi:hypothetical protein